MISDVSCNAMTRTIGSLLMKSQQTLENHLLHNPPHGGEYGLHWEGTSVSLSGPTNSLESVYLDRV